MATAGSGTPGSAALAGELLLALLSKRLGGAAAATELVETETDDQLEQRLMTWLASV